MWARSWFVMAEQTLVEEMNELQVDGSIKVIILFLYRDKYTVESQLEASLACGKMHAVI